jgi:hypothetical protein
VYKALINTSDKMSVLQDKDVVSLLFSFAEEISFDAEGRSDV